MAASGKFIEDELGRKWDRCLTDGVIKLGGGLLIGTAVTLLFFRRRTWPIFTGAGFGIGMAYSNCERDINSTITNESDTEPSLQKG